MRKQGGFGLIEALVVIGTMAILVAIIVVAVDPARQFAMGRNAQRLAGISFIATAVSQNIIDNRGQFTCSSGDIPEEPAMISTRAVPPGYKYDRRLGLPRTYYNLAPCLIPMYTKQVPVDPRFEPAFWDSEFLYNSGYIIHQGLDERITVTAPGAELEADISVTR